MLKGFKDFITRGNLVELAVAFVIGAAFALVVSTFTAMLMGFIGKIGGQPDFGSVTIADVNVGQFINAVISFLIIAAVVFFFVIKPVNALLARHKTEPPIAEDTRKCPECLSEIPTEARRCAFCTAEVAASA